MHPGLISRLAAILLSAVAAAPASASDLTIAAAASLAEAFTDIAIHFEQAHPGTDVRLSFGSSGALLQQIRAGAPVDVFAAADSESMDRAAAEGLINRQWRHDFASNTLVVAVPADATVLPTTLSELAAPRYRRLAFGQPEAVPAGRYARQALQAAGLWETLSPKLVPAHSVRQALDYAARNEVDGAFVYATDLSAQPSRVRLAFKVAVTNPIRYPIAPVLHSRQPDAAGAFVRYVMSEAGQARLRHHGFLGL